MERRQQQASWKLILWIFLLSALLYFFYLVKAILFPFALAAIISLLLDPSVRKLCMLGVPRGLSVLAVFVTFFGGIGLISYKLSPIITNQFAELNVKIQEHIQDFSDVDEFVDSFDLSSEKEPEPNTPQYFMDNFLNNNKNLLSRLGLPNTRAGIVKKYIEPKREWIATELESFMNSLLGMLTSILAQFLFLLFVPILSFMMLSDMEVFRLTSVHWIPVSIRKEFVSVINEVAKVITRYVKGVTLIFLLYSSMAAIVLTVLDVPFSFLLAGVAGFLYLIPYIGSWISTSLIILVTGLSDQTGNVFYQLDNSWLFAIASASIFVLVAMIFDQICFPTVIGKSVGLHPLVSLFVVFSAGTLFGIYGMIFAFPVAGAMKIILEKLVSLTASEKVAIQNLPIVPNRHKSLPKIRNS